MHIKRCLIIVDRIPYPYQYESYPYPRINRWHFLSILIPLPFRYQLWYNNADKGVIVISLRGILLCPSPLCRLNHIIYIICCIFFRLPQQISYDFRGYISTRISQWDVYGSSIIPILSRVCKLIIVIVMFMFYLCDSLIFIYNVLIVTYRVIAIHVHGPFYIRPFIIHGIIPILIYI